MAKGMQKGWGRHFFGPANPSQETAKGKLTRHLNKTHTKKMPGPNSLHLPNLGYAICFVFWFSCFSSFSFVLCCCLLVCSFWGAVCCRNERHCKGKTANSKQKTNTHSTTLHVFSFVICMLNVHAKTKTRILANDHSSGQIERCTF